MDHESYLGGPGGSREPSRVLGRLQIPTRTAHKAAEKPFRLPGRLQRPDSPGGSREPCGHAGRQLGKDQGGTREAGKDQVDSL